MKRIAFDAAKIPPGGDLARPAQTDAANPIANWA
jgi:hypothetical protein